MGHFDDLPSPGHLEKAREKRDATIASAFVELAARLPGESAPWTLGEYKGSDFGSPFYASLHQDGRVEPSLRDGVHGIMGRRFFDWLDMMPEEQTRAAIEAMRRYYERERWRDFRDH